MISDFYSVFLYISFFGLSDLLIQYLNIKTLSHKFMYYLCILIISISFYSFVPLK